VDGIFKTLDRKTKLLDFNQWNHCNNIVISWISNSFEPDITEMISAHSISQEMWDAIHDHYQHRDLTRIYKLRRDIVELK